MILNIPRAQHIESSNNIMYYNIRSQSYITNKYAFIFTTYEHVCTRERTFAHKHIIIHITVINIYVEVSENQCIIYTCRVEH